jgi:hypothetical protein
MRAHHQALRRQVLAHQRLKTPAFFRGDLYGSAAQRAIANTVLYPCPGVIELL